MEMVLYLCILVGAVLVPAIFAVWSAELIHAAIAMLVLSLGVTVLLFHLGAPLAGVFELLVCAGLISVLFILVLSLTPPVTIEAKAEGRKKHYRKYSGLPIVIMALAVLLWCTRAHWMAMVPIVNAQETKSVGEILWGARGLDLVGQITILLVGVYGVVVLFRRGRINE
jgi:NADH-quinone oxidoreductase subunit J